MKKASSVNEIAFASSEVEQQFVKFLLPVTGVTGLLGGVRRERTP